MIIVGHQTSSLSQLVLKKPEFLGEFQQNIFKSRVGGELQGM